MSAEGLNEKFDAGLKAFRRGETRCSNPHPAWTDFAISWEHGWLAGFQIDIEADKKKRRSAS